MGKLIGTARNMEGDAITVTFESSELSLNGEVNVVSVSMQMDGGGGGYKPVKYTTCTVELLADGLALIELWKSRYVRARVVNETTGVVLFHGWVSPNNYNVSVTGINDSITVECVDVLGYAQFEPYTLVDPPNGPQVLALGEVCAHVVEIIGAKAAFVANDIVLRKAVERSAEGVVTYKTTERYDLMEVAETYFIDGGSPRVLPTGLSYEAAAISCYDVLSMIAESLRMTWVQVGEEICLHDYLQAAEAGELEYRDVMDEATHAAAIVAREVLEDSFAGGDTQISALPRYSMVSLGLEGVEKVELLPDVFNEEYLTPDGASVIYEVADTKAVMVQPLVSSLYECRAPSDNEYTNSMIVGVSNEYDYRVRDESGLYFPLGEPLWGKYKNWNYMLRVWIAYNPLPIVMNPIFRRRTAYRVPVQARASLCIQLKWKVQFSVESTQLYPQNTISPKKAVMYCSLQIGDKYYNPDIYGWQSEFCYIKLVVIGDSTFIERNDGHRIDFGAAGPEVPVPLYSGQVDFVLYDFSDKGWRVAYISNFSLSVVPNDYYLIGVPAEPKVTYRGIWTFMAEADTVALPIQHRGVLGNKWFGAVIDGEDYCAVAMIEGVPDADGPVGIDMRLGGRAMLDRVESMANFGDGVEFILPLCDEHNAVSILDTFSCEQLWQGRKVVAAIERDVLRSSIRITLN